MSRYNSTMRADNCSCAIKVKTETFDGEMDIIGVEIVKHCADHEQAY